HLADRAVALEAVEEDHVVGVAEILHLLDDGVVGGIAETDAAAQLFLAALKQEIERTALPALRSLALVAAAVVAPRFLFGAVAAPAEETAFMHRMQCVDEHQRAVDRQTDGGALLAERPQQIGLRSALQSTTDDPVGYAVDVGGANTCAPESGRRRDG